jgi:hypothetical protein
MLIHLFLHTTAIPSVIKYQNPTRKAEKHETANAAAITPNDYHRTSASIDHYASYFSEFLFLQLNSLTHGRPEDSKYPKYTKTLRRCADDL